MGSFLTEDVEATWGKKKGSNGGSGLNFHYLGSHWASVFGRFVKTSGQVRSLLCINCWWLTLYLHQDFFAIFLFKIGREFVSFLVTFCQIVIDWGFHKQMAIKVASEFFFPLLKSSTIASKYSWIQAISKKKST